VLPIHNVELKIVPNKLHPYNPELKLLARKLRKNMTLGEILLWQEIRDKKLVYQFHRQVPLYKYIVDFFCHELQLAIEIDGSSHDHPEVSVNDLTRQEELESYGIQFLRFEE
jgi:very-short-patch-repair endonuclease